MKKYEFTGETKTLKNGTMVKRIRRLPDGLVGGWIENEENLSHKGDCFVYENAAVYGNAAVFGNASVSGNAMVYGNVKVSGNAMVYGDAKVSGNAEIYGNAQVYGYSRVSGNSEVFDNAQVYENGLVYGNAEVYGNGLVSKDAQVYGDGRVYGNARVYGDAIATKKVITSNAHKHYITLTDNYLAIGCKNHPIEHWKKEIDNIAKNHGYTKQELKSLKKLLNALLEQRKIISPYEKHWRVNNNKKEKGK